MKIRNFKSPHSTLIAGRDGLDRRFVLNCKEIERFLVAMQKKISIRGAFASRV